MFSTDLSFSVSAMIRRFLVVVAILAFAGNAPIAAQDLPVISASYQIENGSRKGWLIVTVEVPKGCHIYALSQEGEPPPTKIKVAESTTFTLLEEFRSDKKPHVVENDPVFGQRVETYEEGKINLLAPIEIVDGNDLKKLLVDLKFHGQVCSDSGCKPLFNKPVEVKFAGFYDPPKDEAPEKDKRL